MPECFSRILVREISFMRDFSEPKQKEKRKNKRKFSEKTQFLAYLASNMRFFISQPVEKINFIIFYL